MYKIGKKVIVLLLLALISLFLFLTIFNEKSTIKIIERATVNYIINNRNRLN